MKLKGRTILITGGTRGIGLALVEALGRTNQLIVTGRNPERLAAVRKSHGHVHWIDSDVSSAEQVAKVASEVISKFPDLDVLINNAGVSNAINLQKLNLDERLTQEIEINLKGPIRMINAFMPHLLSRPEAAIVNISSGLAYLPFPSQAIYSATKAGLHSFTQSLRVQLKRTSVKVIEVLPPVVETDMTTSVSGIRKMSAATHAKIVVCGIESGRLEIRPGIVKLLYWASRFVPSLTLRMIAKF